MFGKQLACPVEVCLLHDVTRRNQDILLRNGISYGKHGLQEGLIEVIADAAHLSGGRHVDSKDRVGLLETGE